MEKYLLIESQDHFSSSTVNHIYDLAIDLKKQHNEVMMFFLQNAVFSLRKNINYSEKINELNYFKIPVFADSFSIQERGLFKENLCSCVVVTPLDKIIDCLLDNMKVIWHS